MQEAAQAVSISMTDEIQQVVTPAEDAPVLPAETQAADSSPAPAEATESPADDAGSSEKPRDEDGKFLSAKVQKRIDELTWRNAQKEREAEYWREQALRTQQASKAEEPAKPDPDLKRPTKADYDWDDAKYEEALISYTEAVAERKVQAALKAERDRVALEAREKTWAEREAEFAKANPEYVEKVKRNDTLPISAQMAQVIKTSEVGPQVAIYLADNVEIAGQIATLPVEAAAHALGRIEGMLLAQKQAKAAPAAKPVVSQAPPPPPKIEAVEPDVSKNPYDDSMSINEWFAWRNKDEQRRRRK